MIIKDGKIEFENTFADKVFSTYGEGSREWRIYINCRISAWISSKIKGFFP